MTNGRRLLITGVSGYLGACLLRRAAQEPGWDVFGTYFSHPVQAPFGATLSLDLADQDAVRALVADLRPDAILHTACSNRDPANIAAIAPAARHLARAASDHGARLVHVSTDMVFDGEHAPYSDEAAPAPITDYGRAKAEAEALVAARAPSAAIVRPSLIWSLDPIDRQTAWLLEAHRSGQRATLFTDEFRCPVHVDDLAAALLELAQRPGIVGPLNLGGSQALNRWEFGLKLLAAMKLPSVPHVVPGTVAASGLVRPRNLTMRSQRAAECLATRLRGVDDVLGAAPGRTRRPRYCEG